MKPHIKCYQFDKFSIWYQMPNGKVYRLDAFYDGRFQLDSWEELEFYWVPWVGF